jgi:hypothetical protein
MTPKYCPNCGTKAPSATAKFCTNCGQSLNTLTSTLDKKLASLSKLDWSDKSEAEETNVTELPDIEELQVTISGDDDDEKYVNTLTSFSFTANGGTVFVKPKKVKPRHI